MTPGASPCFAGHALWAGGRGLGQQPLWSARHRLPCPQTGQQPGCGGCPDPQEAKHAERLLPAPLDVLLSAAATDGDLTGCRVWAQRQGQPGYVAMAEKVMVPNADRGDRKGSHAAGGPGLLPKAALPSRTFLLRNGPRPLLLSLPFLGTRCLAGTCQCPPCQ